jgi:thioredoxin-like negative regulator of GroEL
LILLFTSDNCMWCEVVKNMLDDALVDFGEPIPVYEVNIDYQGRIADIYGIRMVPTLACRSGTISGVPSETDLHSFLIQSISAVSSESPQIHIRTALSTARKNMSTARPQTEEIEPVNETCS